MSTISKDKQRYSYYNIEIDASVKRYPQKDILSIQHSNIVNWSKSLSLRKGKATGRRATTRCSGENLPSNEQKHPGRQKTKIKAVERHSVVVVKGNLEDKIWNFKWLILTNVYNLNVSN